MSENRLTFTVLIALIGTAIAATSRPASAQTTPDVSKEARDAERNAAYGEAELAISRRLMDQMTARAQTAATELAALRHDADALAQRVAKLPENDEGKRLASTLNAISARDVRKLMDAPSVVPERLAANQQQIDGIMQQLKAQKERVVAGYVPPDATIDEVKELTSWAHSQRAKVAEQNEWLDQQLLAAPDKFDASKAPTLREALLAFRRTEAVAENEARQKGAERAKAEGEAAMRESARVSELERLLQQATHQLQDARAALDKQRVEHEADLKRQQDENAQKIADLNQQLAQKQAERAKQEAQSQITAEKGKDDAAMMLKREKANSPHVREVLAPFMAAGYSQPGRGTTIDKQPISLASLKKIGALERNENGVSRLIDVAHDDHDKTRPRWAFSGYLRRLTPDQIELAKEAQGYLVDLGDVLVEQKLLSP